MEKIIEINIKLSEADTKYIFDLLCTDKDKRSERLWRHLAEIFNVPDENDPTSIKYYKTERS